MRLIDDEVRAALRAEAVRHRPNREAMLDRITETAMRNQFGRHRAAPRLRISGAAVAVAAVLGGGGFAQWALAGDGTPPPPPPAPVVSTPATPQPTPSGTPKAPAASPPPKSIAPSARADASSKVPRRSSAAPPPSSLPPSNAAVADPAVSRPLRSAGSIDPESGDSQGSGMVTIRTAERLTALEVTIRVARTPGLVSRGGSQQVPGASVTDEVTEEPDALVYRFAVSSGDILEPGTYLFYARYTHADGGRDAGADTYAATAVTEAGATVTISGAFG
ncbi:hypothetical protein [Actinoplanes sp. DH11]|uniref:hypothetical protein n=1 Tax=Actinoplanes sp. DH11 TaxID=2857011 RepID=UPI001E2E7F99|nr:hypothetical protein [Actinoplanes sp. DH11]